MDKQERQERKRGGLWIKDRDSGDKYIFIKLDKKDEFGRPFSEKYVAFSNGFKDEGENRPDYEIYLTREDYEKMKLKKSKAFKKSESTELNEAPKEQVTTENSEL